ncbi:glycosyltransferase family 4 protein [Candidatus Peregrinibacteria bacterium]|nr:MAG: glycosyltransferase family 4 protein [Candidatus Peregrinibacteria bacterium]
MTEPLCIAIDLRPLLDPNESGVQVYVRSIVKRLLQDRSIDWLLFYQARKPCPRIHTLFPQVLHLPHSNSKFHLAAALHFSKLPKKYFPKTPDLLWMPDRRPFYRCPFPVVMTVHDRIPEKDRSSLSLKSRLWHRLFPLKRLLKLSDGLLFPSLTVAQSLAFKGPKEVTYEGVEPFVKPKRPQSLSSAITAKNFYLALSPADPRKRLEWIARAAARFPKMNFVVAGLKPKDSRFKKLELTRHKNLHFLSFVNEEEKTWLYKNAKALLALSRAEGFDLPVLEAVRAKCPVLLSNIPVHHELYKNAEWIQTEEDLWKALYLGQKGKLKIPTPRGNYNWDFAAQRTLLFFLRVLRHEDGKRGRHWHSHDHAHDTQSFEPNEHR